MLIMILALQMGVVIACDLLNDFHRSPQGQTVRK